MYFEMTSNAGTKGEHACGELVVVESDRLDGGAVQPPRDVESRRGTRVNTT